MKIDIMKHHYRFFGPALMILLLALVGCSGTFGMAVEVNNVDETSVVSVLNYRDGRNTGPAYAVSLTVPEDWVGQFETRTNDNQLIFSLVDGARHSAILTIEALSVAQYWKQIGGYPGDFTNIIFTADTYFIYHFPGFNFYTSLSEDEYAAFVDVIPSVVQTLAVERVG